MSKKQPAQNRTPEPHPAPTIAAIVVQRLELARKHDAPIVDNQTDLGADGIVAQLRAAAPYAPAIALCAELFDRGGNLVETAVDAMHEARCRVLHYTPDDDETFCMKTESFYLLGVLVGMEFAAGLRGGAR